MNNGEKILTIQTSRFGEVKIDECVILEFVSPIIGYNNHKFFALIDYSADSPFKWLQSTHDPELAFAVTLCSYFNIDYQFELSDENAETLGIKDANDILALNIVTIPHECPQNATINLLAPIILNTETKQAMQVILHDQNFEIKHPLFQNKDEYEMCSIG